MKFYAEMTEEHPSDVMKFRYTLMPLPFKSFKNNSRENNKRFSLYENYNFFAFYNSTAAQIFVKYKVRTVGRR